MTPTPYRYPVGTQVTYTDCMGTTTQTGTVTAQPGPYGVTIDNYLFVPVSLIRGVVR